MKSQEARTHQSRTASSIPRRRFFRSLLLCPPRLSPPRGQIKRLCLCFPGTSYKRLGRKENLNINRTASDEVRPRGMRGNCRSSYCIVRVSMRWRVLNKTRAWSEEGESAFLLERKYGFCVERLFGTLCNLVCLEKTPWDFAFLRILSPLGRQQHMLRPTLALLALHEDHHNPANRETLEQSSRVTQGLYIIITTVVVCSHWSTREQGITFV